MSAMHGRFVWYELMTTNTEAAKAFYSRVIGWGTAPFKGGGEPYTLWMAGETSVGGMMTLPEEARKMGAPPSWTGYVAVPDVDATAKQAAALGGKVLVPGTDIPEVGRFAILQDPQGATLAAFRPAGREEMPLPKEPQKGQFSWHELTTTDWKAAFTFYSKLFGWREMQRMDMGEMGTYLIYGVGETQLGGMSNTPPQMKAPPHWLYYVRVDDAGAAAERVKAHGGRVLNGPMEVPGGDKIAQMMDPQGAMFAVHAKR